MEQLRERGIYAFPQGGEFVAHIVAARVYVLYTPAAWEFFGLHAYESDEVGNIRIQGRPTSWQIKDLTDTSRTARSRSKGGAAQTACIEE